MRPAKDGLLPSTEQNRRKAFSGFDQNPANANLPSAVSGFFNKFWGSFNKSQATGRGASTGQQQASQHQTDLNSQLHQFKTFDHIPKPTESSVSECSSQQVVLIAGNARSASTTHYGEASKQSA